MKSTSKPHSSPDRRWGRALVRTAASAGAAYAVLLVLLFFLESSLVYPAPATESGGESLAAAGQETFVIPASDGVQIHGVYCPHPDPRHTIVFFHGNAEDVQTSAAWLRALGHVLSADVMMFDYRGYGASAGRPSQAGLVRDGVAAVDWLVRRTGQPSETFLYLGRSLGGAVAIEVAQQRKPLGLVLVSTFDSLVRVAGEHLPWLPVSLLMRNRFESVEVLAALDVPLLQIHGDRDRIVPIERGRALFEAARGLPRRWVTATDKGHNDLPVEDHILAITQFGLEAWQAYRDENR